MTKNKTLQYPSFTQLFLGSIGTILTGLKKNNQLLPPSRLGDYVLLEVLKKEDNANSMTFGIYMLDGEKFFVKSWNGKIKDLNFYGLVNEYCTSMFFQENTFNTPSRITFPKVKDIFLDAESFSVVFEYIEGTSLHLKETEEQAKYITEILNFFNAISREFTPDAVGKFGRRGPAFYLVMLHITTFLSLISDIKNYKIILQTFARAFYDFHKICNTPLTVTHRDLTPNNIMIVNKQIYVLDTENMIITVPGYDYSFLCATPGLEKLNDALFKNFSEPNIFLRNYIAIHHILGSGNFFKVNSDYVKYLYELK